MGRRPVSGAHGKEYAFNVGGFLPYVPCPRVGPNVTGHLGRSVVSDDHGVLAVTWLID